MLGARTETTARDRATCWPAPARSTRCPSCSPARTIFNRLWPLLLFTIGAGALSVFAPQIGGIAAGFAIIWALAWRRQEAAVAAIEERDGVRFYVDKTSPLKAIRLVRTPGFSGDFLHSRLGARENGPPIIFNDLPRAMARTRRAREHDRQRADSVVSVSCVLRRPAGR